MTIKNVALVGHCGFDSGPLSRLAQQLAPHAKVVRVNDQKTLDTISGQDALLLVNRVLDGRFDVGGSGIELITTYAQLNNAPAMMLVSNYADAQQQAQDAGALPGLGKSQIGDPATLQRLTEAIAEADQIPHDE